MLRQRLFSLSVLLLLAGLLSGCFYSRELARTRRAIERQYPEAHFERTALVSLGPGTLNTLSWLSGFGPGVEGRIVSDYLYDLRRVKVGVYKVERLPSLDGLELDQLGRFKKRGWETVVRVREEEELVWVLYRTTRTSIRDVYVLVLTPGELVMTRLEGRLDRLLARILADYGHVIPRLREEHPSGPGAPADR